MIAMILASLLLLLPIIALATQLLLSRSHYHNLMSAIQLVFCVLITVVVSALLISQQTIVIHIANWPAPYSICLVFDTLTKFLLLIFMIVICCITIFSIGEHTVARFKRAFYLGTWPLVLGLIGALSTYDIFNLYVWFEVILVSAFILLNTRKQTSIRGLYHYAIFNIIGTLIMLLAIALIYGQTGDLNYLAIANQLSSNTQHTQIIPGITLFLLGFAIKGGIFPFYFWLPQAYPEASTSSTMLLASIITKAIMLILLRLVIMWHITTLSPTTSLVFIFLACCTMFLGVMGAATNTRIRHILSFHVISQLGYILFAIFISTTFAIIAALFFLIHNVLVKTSLFMTSGIIEQHYQTDELSVLGHIKAKSPLLAALFFISAMSLAGLPPLSGFWGKWLVFKVALASHAYIPLFIAIVVSMFTLYSMIKIWRYAYCQAAPSSTASPPLSLKSSQLVAILPLVLIALTIGCYPDTILPTLHTIADNLQHPELVSQLIMEQPA